MADPLKRYREKRNFDVTSEPAEGGEANEDARAFVIQKHWASRLHYDLRLEVDGAMKSWAVPKGPSFDPAIKRMAVQVEDHPIAYNQFEGTIPAGQYGAGKVIIWDEGTWTPLTDARRGLRDGMLKFEMHGVKMRGRWALIRMKDKGEKQPAWLLIKEKDDYVRPDAEFSVVDEMPDSVVPLRKAAKGARAAKTGKAAKAAETGRAAKAAETAEVSATVTPATSARSSGARALPGEKAALPATLKPQLATLVDGLPGNAGDWLFEVKYDGYRMLARRDRKEVRLFTRNGNDWTHKLPHIAQAVGKLAHTSGWLDGELVVLDEKGVPSFQRLQNAFDSTRTDSIVFYLFDVPFLEGRDLRQEPLETRRALLRQLIGSRAPASLHFSETFDARPQDLVASACKMGLEGIIGKLKGAPYVSRRSDSWIKLKCTQRQEFVIAGYTDPKGSRSGLGSLLLAIHDEHGKLQYAGNVGTGFDDKTLTAVKRQLDAVAAGTSPLAGPTDLDRTAHWVKPVLLAEVSFGEWTSSGRIRHAVFHGLRSDKKPRDITREKPVSARKVAANATGKSTSGATKTKKAAAHSAKKATMSSAKKGAARSSKNVAAPGKPEGQQTSLHLTHGERVIDSSTGSTKLDLVRFYALVSSMLLPHLKARPVSLVRAPAGIEGELFFQKHLEGKMPGVRALDQALDPGHPPLLEVSTTQALLSATQMNVVEFHTWNAVKTAIAKPDRMTFDLDPGEGVPWKSVQQAAQLVHAFLTELGLASFLKTSGGKGLHVIVPLKKQYDWDCVKSFSQAIVQHLADTIPQIFVAKSGPKNRVGKIYVDYLRNGFGATTASAWSARARPGLGVSVPLAWDEIESIKSGAHWTIANIESRLDQGNAPWKGYAPQSITKAMKTLGFQYPA